MKTAEDIINEKKMKMVTISHNHTVMDAVRIMKADNIGAIVVEKEGEVTGLWTERDLLRNIADSGFDPHTARIGGHMTSHLQCAAHDTSLIRLEEMFLGLFVRHILIKKNERYIGLLSIGDVLRASLLEKDKQIRELNSIASWEYYENWGWDRKLKKKKKK